MSKLAYIVVVFVAITGCHSDPAYCPGAPSDNCNLIDAPIQGCTGDPQCSGATPVCDTTSKACVQCTMSEATACVATTPLCGADEMCHGCTQHSDCASDVCLPDGSCSDGTNVAYVSASGGGTTCTKAAPCATVDVALQTTKPLVKIAAGLIKDNKTTTIDGKAVMILASPGAMLDRDGDGAILDVRSANADVKIYDLEVRGATGVAGGDAIQLNPNGGSPKLSLTRCKIDSNQGLGIAATGGSLTVTQSTISGNTGGGLSISNGRFNIVGNAFFQNGSGSTSVGGIAIAAAQDATNRLDFNSFSKNQTQDTVGSAIQCTAGTFTARNNILSGNGTLTNQEQTGGGCKHAYTIARPGTIPVGSGNVASDPLFKNTTTGDLHLLTGSPAHGAADPASDLSGVAATDIDGVARVAPADMGAYVYQ